MSEIEEELLISEKGFDKMTNLKFLKFYTNSGDKQAKVHIPHGLDYLCHQLILLHWEGFPMRCMPSYFFPIYLVELTMIDSKLVVLWSGIQVHTEFSLPAKLEFLFIYSYSVSSCFHC